MAVVEGFHRASTFYLMLTLGMEQEEGRGYDEL